MFDIERIIESTGVIMDKTKQQSSTKEQRIRYIKALLRGAKAEMDKKEKARSEFEDSESEPSEDNPEFLR
jgi:hypothetical protein